MCLKFPKKNMGSSESLWKGAETSPIQIRDIFFRVQVPTYLGLQSCKLSSLPFSFPAARAPISLLRRTLGFLDFNSVANRTIQCDFLLKK